MRTVHLYIYDLIITFNTLDSRYVDITEAIDTNDASFMDNSDFQTADAIPLNVDLPEAHYVDNEVRRPTEFFEVLLFMISSFSFCCIG